MIPLMTGQSRMYIPPPPRSHRRKTAQLFHDRYNNPSFIDRVRGFYYEEAHNDHPYHESKHRRKTAHPVLKYAAALALIALPKAYAIAKEVNVDDAYASARSAKPAVIDLSYDRMFSAIPPIIKQRANSTIPAKNVTGKPVRAVKVNQNAYVMPMGVPETPGAVVTDCGKVALMDSLNSRAVGGAQARGAYVRTFPKASDIALASAIDPQALAGTPVMPVAASPLSDRPGTLAYIASPNDPSGKQAETVVVLGKMPSANADSAEIYALGGVTDQTDALGNQIVRQYSPAALDNLSGLPTVDTQGEVNSSVIQAMTSNREQTERTFKVVLNGSVPGSFTVFALRGIDSQMVQEAVVRNSNQPFQIVNCTAKNKN
jgi:hypothetical protein